MNDSWSIAILFRIWNDKNCDQIWTLGARTDHQYALILTSIIFITENQTFEKIGNESRIHVFETLSTSFLSKN